MRRARICSLAIAGSLTIAASLGPAAGARAAVIGAVAHTGGAPSQGGTSQGGTSPTRTQIRRAVTRAERSTYLWATVNVCVRKGRHHGGVIGVRGEMGALSFSTTLSMTIQLGEYSTAKDRFVAVSGTTARHTVTVGALTSGIHQDGAEFHYSTDTGRLDAIVTFTWTRAGKRLAHVTRATTGGHPSAAFGQPPGRSTASCRL